MDNFDSNNNMSNLKKVGKLIVYLIVIAVVFVGGGAFYKYIFAGIEDQYNNGFSFNQNAPVAAEVTPNVVNMGTYPNQNPTTGYFTPTPQVGMTATPTISATPVVTKSPLPTATAKPKLTQRERILDQMHKMANTKVVADLVWGEIPITEENITKLIEEVSETTFSDRDKLLTILENWKRNDFSNAVNDHNYVWEQLGGTIGKATALR